MTQPGTRRPGQQTVYPTRPAGGPREARTSSNEVIFTQGNFQQTDNPLDVVIQGNGFFQIRTPSGNLAYTRAGSFQLDRNGNLVTSDGNPLDPQITIPPQRAEHQHRHRWHGQLHNAGPDRGADGRADPVGGFSESGGLNSVGHNLYTPDRRLGRRHRRRARAARKAGHAAAGLCRAIQRQRGRRVHQPDRGAARL